MDAIYAGYGEVATQAMPPGMWGRVANPQPITYDPAKAKQLLSEAGFPNGFETEIFCVASPEWEPRACNVMAEQWAKVGVKVNVTVLPAAQYWEIWDKETTPFAFTAWSHRPLGVMVLGLAFRTGAPWNESKWSNPRCWTSIKSSRT